MFLLPAVTWWNSRTSTIQSLYKMHTHISPVSSPHQNKEKSLYECMSKELQQCRVTVQEIFLFFKLSTQPPVHWVQRIRWPPCIAEVKIEWSYTSTSLMSLHDFMAWTG
jgi:hypothetical protein